MANSNKVTLQIDAIIQAFSCIDDGASIEQIKAACGLNIELRTLQRRLAELKKEGYVKTSGDKRSTRYHSTMYHVNLSRSIVKEPSQPYATTIQLSEKSLEIQSLVSRPVQQRERVSYNREFLESYRPNIDSYLTQEEKKWLAEISRTLREDKPAGTFAKEILNRLLIDLSWNSSRLEGNSYSLLETERLLVQGLAGNKKTLTETQMILNHKDAIEFIVKGADSNCFNRYTILNLHAMLSDNLLPEPKSSGSIRTIAVGITNSAYTPLAIPQVLDELFEMILQKAEQIENPFEQAFFFMVQLPYLQPFEDVNKRVSRLGANIPLNRHNLSPISFIDVPREYYIQGLMGIYELNRIDLMKDVFIWAYERSSRKYAAMLHTIGEPDPFHVKYRQQKRRLVAEIISRALDRETAIAVINDRALFLPAEDRERFIEFVETGLMSLHDGNFATYFVSPNEFKQWKQAWEI
ncbi:cell filamentation protein Fic [Niastella vici]|uniref:Cell filamentation protein Fic n=1 Tax=Niastella vici TaxID=1703345 RepID=A0A1V9FY45_9BACT|nr:Fic family protein [Niastella vici]OQP63311.1 cell filamentation protein Fic [Niastella vici]